MTITWNWTDNSGGSGIDNANCTISSTSSGEGSAVVVSATCKDLAGNTGNASVTLKIDKTKPTLAPTVSPNPVLRYLSATATPNASDTGGSGIASSSCPAISTNTLGNFSVTCTATDNAGNSNTVSVSYTILSSVQGVGSLISVVNGLPGVSSFNRTMLLSYLLNAQNALNSGQRFQAITHLNYFIATVNGLRPSGGLTAAQADDLVTQAQRIIQSINAGG